MKDGEVYSESRRAWDGTRVMYMLLRVSRKASEVTFTLRAKRVMGLKQVTE